jgi:hypothetical protein
MPNPDPPAAEPPSVTNAGRDPGTPGGQPPEDVEDRPNVGTTRPEEYPEDMRENGVT